ncbi:hypothetical protein E2562_032630 [Oryza meyeriana var. granulata]|uniref:Uncharacterized protein n=1 Tax=Oryza meyeriana var. granulata TaxID=110450 RepID=A0A6G1DAB3_9ORYZ|nr:hypothetical protein E2562_032630 [Oryza meyeriana var. granulata]
MIDGAVNGLYKRPVQLWRSTDCGNHGTQAVKLYFNVGLSCYLAMVNGAINALNSSGIFASGQPISLQFAAKKQQDD